MAATPTPKKTAAKKPARAVASARKSTDKRVVGTAASPKKVAAPTAYKPPAPPKVEKKKAGRPKKAS